MEYTPPEEFPRILRPIRTSRASCSDNLKDRWTNLTHAFTPASGVEHRTLSWSSRCRCSFEYVWQRYVSSEHDFGRTRRVVFRAVCWRQRRPHALRSPRRVQGAPEIAPNSHARGARCWGRRDRGLWQPAMGESEQAGCGYGGWWPCGAHVLDGGAIQRDPHAEILHHDSVGDPRTFSAVHGAQGGDRRSHLGGRGQLLGDCDTEDAGGEQGGRGSFVCQEHYRSGLQSRPRGVERVQLRALRGDPPRLPTRVHGAHVGRVVCVH